MTGLVNYEEYEFPCYENFIPKHVEGGKQLRLTEREALRQGYKREPRFNIVNKLTEESVTVYFQHYMLILHSLSVVHNDMARYSGSRFLAMLGAGYIPVYTPPSEGDFSYIEKGIIDYLNMKDIKHYTESQHSIISDKTISTGKYDIWASRIELSEIMGVPVEKFDIIQFLSKEVVPTWS